MQKIIESLTQQIQEVRTVLNHCEKDVGQTLSILFCECLGTSRFDPWRRGMSYLLLLTFSQM